MKVDTEAVDVGRDRIALVRLAGSLTVESAGTVRSGLLKAVTAEPSLVVAHVAAMTAEEDISLALFPAVARQAAAWPGISVALAEPRPDLSAALDRMAVCRHLTVFPSLAEAYRVADRTPPRRLTRTLVARAMAVRDARALVAAGCEQWSVTQVSGVAELIITELVSNAVRHVGDLIEVSVALRRRYLHLTVRDRSPAPPRAGVGDGRGLLLVDTLSVAWGHTTVDDGKVVWATLRLP